MNISRLPCPLIDTETEVLSEVSSGDKNGNIPTMWLIVEVQLGGICLEKHTEIEELVSKKKRKNLGKTNI